MIWSYLQSKISSSLTKALFCFLVLAIFVPSISLAAANPQMNYQGKLTDGSGVAVADGTYNMRFWLIASSTAATSSALWTESLTGGSQVQVSNGLFSIMLGSSTPLTTVDFNQVLYLGVEIGGVSTSTPTWDGEMSPRKILGTVPAAFVANYAATAGAASSSDNTTLLGGVASTSFLRSDQADDMTATSSGTLISFIQNGAGAIARFFSGVTEVFTILGNGNVGVGTSTPETKFAVAGDARITGTSTLATTTIATLNLGAALSAVNGGTGLSSITQNQLLIGGAGNTWSQVATSALGLGDNTFLGLSDTQNSYTANRLLFTNSGATALTDSANLVFDGTNFGIGTSTPNSRLTIQGAAGTANTFTIASSTGSTTLAMLANGNLELPGQLISAGVKWTSRSAAAVNSWTSVTYGNGLFVAISVDVTNRVMTSPDGIIWTARTATEANFWYSVTYGNGLFVAVSLTGTNRVMTSPDGITWTARSAAQANSWISVTYGNGLFVAVSSDGTNRVMTSPDGITWTARSAAQANSWISVTYGNGLFVAVSSDGTNRVMTSPDGITWTARSAAQANSWISVTYGNGLFVAVSSDGTNRVMTSPDGITWTARSAAQANQWKSIIYGNGLFVAVSSDGTNRVITSPDGITWTARSAAEDNNWNSVTYGNGLFVAVASSGTSRVMTSGFTQENQLAHNNIYQGGTSFFGGLRAGTTTASIASIFLQSQGGINPFAIASSSGASLLTLTQAGNLGLGSSTPGAMLTVAGNTYIDGSLTAAGTVTTPVITSTTTLSIDSATTSALSIGTNAAAKTITIGNVTGATALNFNTGTGGSTFTTTNGAFNLLTGTGAINVGADAAAKTITIGNSTGASSLVFNSGTAGSVFSTGNVAIGTTSMNSRLTIQGAAGTANTFTIASSTGSTTLAMLANGNLELGGQLISAGIKWTGRSAASSTAAYNSVTYGNGLFVAVGTNIAMYSSDGINWATSTVAEANPWFGVTYGNGLFVAVANSGTNRVMTSPDGITWTVRSAAETNPWFKIVYGNGLFVAIAYTGTNRVMTSPDGITWTARSAAEANNWRNITYGNGLFVAVSSDGTSRVMTSPDGITWTARVAAEDSTWQTITYGNGLFVAISQSDTNRAMTSPDGITWTVRVIGTNTWTSVTYGNGLFVAVPDSSSNQVMTSPDGITWTARSAAEANIWTSVTYGNGLFVAVSQSGTSRVMTSGFTQENQLAHNNIYQGGTSFFGGLRAGTTTASIASIFLQSQGGINPFAIASSSGASLLTLTQAGRLGIGTTTPTELLSVAGNTYIGGNLTATGISTLTNASTTNLSISGNLYDSSNSAGTSGMILKTTGSGATWVATSSLGLGDGTFLGLSDTQNSYTANRLLFTNSGATALTDSASLVFDGTNFGLGTSTPNSRLTIQGAAGTANTFTIASSTGSTTLAMLANGNLELPGQLISAGVNWTARTAASSTASYKGVTYGNGLFVAVGVGYAMYSSDGINWATSTVAEANSWNSVTYGNGLFVAVSSDGTSRVMTSPDGITWTARTAAEDNSWLSITYGNDLFVSVSNSGTNRVMTSPDGVTWTARSSNNYIWNSVTYGNGLFVAVGFDTNASVMTSPDGIIWTARTAAGDEENWTSVTYGNGLFVAGGDNEDGTDRIMTSSDGIIWIAQSVGGNSNWYAITYGNGLFVALSWNSTNQAMTSPDGITWTNRNAMSTNFWRSITYGNGRFVAVADTGTSRVMTSGFTETSALAHNNIYQGGTSFFGGLRAGTTTASIASIFLQSQGGINPFAIASSSGASLLTLTQAGNLGLGSSTPGAMLTVAGNTYISGDLTVTGTTTTRIITSTSTLSIDSATTSALTIGTGANAKTITIGNVTGATALNFNTGTGGSTFTTTNGAFNLLTGTGAINVGADAAAKTITIGNSTGASSLVFNSGTAGSVFSTGNVAIGTTSMNSRLTIQGAAGTANTFTIASSTGSTTLAMLANGNLELGGQLISAGIKWTGRSAAEANSWNSVTYGNGLFVAVANSGTNRVMTSPDGVNWSTSTAAEANSWNSVTYGNGLFVAVAYDGTNRVMTSPDGITWTARTAAEASNWYSVTYGNGLFVAVALEGNGGCYNLADGYNCVMTSPDGITWTARSTLANLWYSVTYGNGLFVAVSWDGVNQVMTSPDGITWTVRTATDANQWVSVTYGNGLFVAVAESGIRRVMTSPDGITWTARIAAEANQWASITYGNGLFVAVSSNGTNRVMTSLDGITWTARTAAEANVWNSVTYGNGRFVAVSSNGTNRVMISGFTQENQLAHNNIYQGGTSFFGGLRAGTTTASIASIFLQSQGGINPFAIASSSGASLLTLTQAGNLGLGTTSPVARLGMENLSVTGANVAGIDQYFSFANGTASAVQYGNRAYLKTTNSTTTTLVGDIIRLEDSTAYSNTVRGLEVQVERGTNTLGENTAISGFARTFGLRGVTEGDAGAVYEPAGVYGETQGTTQGNAFRGYSSSITTAALVKLFQDTSTFTGTGLLMNFGNSGGSFSSTTASRFLDFQNAGTSRFTVGAYGMLTIGDGTTGQNAGLQIGYGGLCVDNDGTCNASTTGRITSVSSATGNSDLAEMYFSSDDLLPGEVVYQKGGLSIGRASSETAGLVFGVVSTEPGLLLGQDDTSGVTGEAGYPIALAGRVPVRLSNENGAIKTGDELMLSSLPGVVMKASSTGMVVGLALEDFDPTRSYSDTFINQFGENIIVPNYVPINREADPRLNDGCYYSGGAATGEAVCVPLKATTTEAQFDEADALAALEAKEEALADLAKVKSQKQTLENGQAVQVGQIVMFVDLHYRYLDTAGTDMIIALLATTSDQVGDGEDGTLWRRLVTLAENFVDGVLNILTLKAERVETNELCVDGVCINAGDLQKLLEANPESIVEVTPMPIDPPLEVPPVVGDPDPVVITPPEEPSADPLLEVSTLPAVPPEQTPEEPIPVAETPPESVDPALMAPVEPVEAEPTAEAV